MDANEREFGYDAYASFVCVHPRSFAAILLLLIGAGFTAAAEPARRPNLVLIMTDNQGAWTLGCYGNKDVRSPNIDRLAREGVLFTQAFSSNSVCSPTRATFLTGLIPSQHGVHSFLGGEKPSAQLGPDAYCTIREFSNLPKILAASGYTCGLAGKWHLGDSLHPQEGFSYWFTKTVGSTQSFFKEQAIWREQVYTETRYFTDVITDHAVEFVEQNRARPFFLFLAYNAPYGLGGTMKEVHQNRHTAFYADQPLDSFPRVEPHPWLFNNRDFQANPLSIRSYAAAVSGMDDGVGRVLDTLKRLDLERETLIVFTADQGWAGGQGGFWGMGDHSRPINTRERTLHIPLIYRWPGRVPEGKRSDLLTSNYDFLPTVLDLLGLGDTKPTKPPLPGQSCADVVLGKTAQPEGWHDAIFMEYENTRMVRTDRWKLTRRHPSGPDELYDIAADPEETKNLIHDDVHSATRAELNQRLDEFFARHADPQYDLWRSGRSRAGRLLKED